MSTLDWTAIILGVLIAVPATIGAVASVRNRRDLRMTNGLTAGETIDASHVRLGRVESKVDRVDYKVDLVDGRVERVDAALDRHLTEVGDGSSKMAAWVRKKMAEDGGEGAITPRTFEVGEEG